MPTAGAMNIARGNDIPASNGPSHGFNEYIIWLNTPYIVSNAIPANKNAGVSVFVMVPLPSIASIPTINPRKAKSHPIHTPLLVDRIGSSPFW